MSPAGTSAGRRTTRGENPSGVPPEAKGSEARGLMAKKLGVPLPETRGNRAGRPGSN